MTNIDGEMTYIQTKSSKLNVHVFQFNLNMEFSVVATLQHCKHNVIVELGGGGECQESQGSKMSLIKQEFILILFAAAELLWN